MQMDLGKQTFLFRNQPSGFMWLLGLGSSGQTRGFNPGQDTATEPRVRRRQRSYPAELIPGQRRTPPPSPRERAGAGARL